MKWKLDIGGVVAEARCHISGAIRPDNRKPLLARRTPTQGAAGLVDGPMEGLQEFEQRLRRRSAGHRRNSHRPVTQSQGNRWCRVSVYSPSGIRHRMSNAHDITEDIVFDLVSIQYHALQGSHLYEQFLSDAQEVNHPEVVEFIAECKSNDAERAKRCHELLVLLTAETQT